MVPYSKSADRPHWLTLALGRVNIVLIEKALVAHCAPQASPPPTATARTAESAEDVVDVVKAAIDLAGYVPAKFENPAC